MKKELLGEFIGTLILVFIGCGSVASAVLYNNLTLWQVALIWGTGVAIAIYSTSTYSKSHLNPAVSFGFYLQKKITLKQLSFYSLFQLLGGVVGGFLVFIFFKNDITALPADQATAQIFGEFFPNLGFKDEVSIDHLGAFCYELIGTMFLFLIIQIAILPLPSKLNISPIVIGLGLSCLIYWIAPFTQAGFNPARDFGPRLFAFFSNWKEQSLPQPYYSFATVYIIAPVLGAGLAAIISRKWNK